MQVLHFAQLGGEEEKGRCIGPAPSGASPGIRLVPLGRTVRRAESPFCVGIEGAELLRVHSEEIHLQGGLSKRCLLPADVGLSYSSDRDVCRKWS